MNKLLETTLMLMRGAIIVTINNVRYNILQKDGQYQMFYSRRFGVVFKVKEPAQVEEFCKIIRKHFVPFECPDLMTTNKNQIRSIIAKQNKSKT